MKLTLLLSIPLLIVAGQNSQAIAHASPRAMNRSNQHQRTSSRRVFAENCAVCHGSNGTGNTPVGKAMNAADLTSSKIQRQSNAMLAHFIGKGEGQMPAFDNVLTPQQIKDQVKYIRRLAHKKQPKK